MIKNKIPGFYRLSNNKILSVTYLSSFIIFLTNITLYFLDDKNNKYIEYELHNFHNFINSFIYCINTMIIFFILNTFLDNSFWNNKGKKDWYINDGEQPRHNMLIIRPLNSHSSIFLFYIGVYSLYEINDNTQYYYACYLFGISHIFLGISSYLWWASNLNNIHIIDNLCMELIINSISVLGWTTIFPSYELYFIFLSILYFIIHAIDFKKAYLVELSINFLVSSVLTSYYNGNGNQYIFFIGSLFSFGGLIPKAGSIFSNFRLGTSIFHIMESVGLFMYYIWIQTLQTN